MHTHFGSATHFLSTLLNVVLGLTLWRLGWMHVLNARRGPLAGPFWKGLARAALFQA